MDGCDGGECVHGRVRSWASAFVGGGWFSSATVGAVDDGGRGGR
jgi:hypothetical protein